MNIPFNPARLWNSLARIWMVFFSSGARDALTKDGAPGPLGISSP